MLPERRRPVAVAAHGADPLGTGRACVGYLTLQLTGGAIAHVHVNWLSPDQDADHHRSAAPSAPWSGTTSTPRQRMTVFDRGVDLVAGRPT